VIHALHGNVGSPGDLEGILTGLNRPFRAWDLWDRLAQNTRCASLEGFGSMLNEAAADDTAPRIVLGYSLGARLALHALTQNPGLWHAAILISPHPGLQNNEERHARLLQDQRWQARFFNDPWDKVLNDWNHQPVLSGTTNPQSDLEPSRRQIAQAFDTWSLGRQQDLHPLLSSVTCPVLWITGERDKKFTALAACACPLLPQGSLAIVTDAGHRVHLDQPGAVTGKIKEFLSAAGW
jgi:2-succinyl-6-hydroxy-2,4-cyclohexadiene-1-carboxylate synthase